MRKYKPHFWIWFAVSLLFIGCTSQRAIPSCKVKDLLAQSEVEGIQQRSSDFRINVSELESWDKIVSDLLSKSPLKRRADPYRLYAYLYYAQKSFADNSFLITNNFSGSLDLISLQVVNLFYPDYKNENIKSDLFSKELTETIMKKIQDRYQKEEQQIHQLPIKIKEGDWNGENPVGLDYPMMKPWALKSADEFKSPKPPTPNDPFWQNQLKEVKEKSKRATEEQKEQSLFWERMIDPEAADWRFISVKYMNDVSIPLEMQLEVRSKMMMALIDALIIVFQDKYTYLVRRPFMLDPGLKTLFTTPNHPSYPAAHATMSGAAETILSYYFPENEKEWNQLAREARESRLWGAIHFPVDLEVGKKQGQLVGKAVLFR